MMILLSVLEIAACVGLAVIVYLQLGLRSYAQEKGKNLATKEDIAAITREVEGVKAEYVRPLLTDPDFEVSAGAGYLLAVLGEPDGI